MFKILDKKMLVPNVHELVIRAPKVAEKARAGQFIILMPDEEGERIALTLSDWDPEQGTISIVVLNVGLSSGKIAAKNPGDDFPHLAGPLGEPITIPSGETVALLGGCYGIGALVCLARALKQGDNRVISITEARSHYLHYYGDKLAAYSDELIQATMDGSSGVKGHAVDPLVQKLRDGEKIDRIVAVGCPFMMMITAHETKEFGIDTLAALNPIMVDGTGMCGACRVTVGGKTKFACVDGPFFDAQQIDWDELFARKSAYHEEEVEAVERGPRTPSRHHHH